MQELWNTLANQAIEVLNGAGGALAGFVSEVATYGVVSNMIHAVLSPLPLVALVLVAWRLGPALVAKISAGLDGNSGSDFVWAVGSIPACILGVIFGVFSFFGACSLPYHLDDAAKAYYAPKLYVIQELQRIRR